MPLRVLMAGAPGSIWLTGELDAATFKTADWQQGGRARVMFEHDRGAGVTFAADVTLEPGQRTFSAVAPPG